MQFIQAQLHMSEIHDMYGTHHNFGSFGRCIAHHPKEWLDDIASLVIGNGADAATEIGHSNINIQPIPKSGTGPLGLVECIGYGSDHSIDSVGRRRGRITAATPTTCTHVGIVAANR